MRSLENHVPEDTPLGEYLQKENSLAETTTLAHARDIFAVINSAQFLINEAQKKQKTYFESKFRNAKRTLDISVSRDPASGLATSVSWSTYGINVRPEAWSIGTDHSRTTGELRTEWVTYKGPNILERRQNYGLNHYSYQFNSLGVPKSAITYLLALRNNTLAIQLSSSWRRWIFPDFNPEHKPLLDRYYTGGVFGDMFGHIFGDKVNLEPDTKFPDPAHAYYIMQPIGPIERITLSLLPADTPFNQHWLSMDRTINLKSDTNHYQEDIHQEYGDARVEIATSQDIMTVSAKGNSTFFHASPINSLQLSYPVVKPGPILDNFARGVDTLLSGIAELPPIA